MNFWQRWVRAPQTTTLRRVLMQVHLWLGVAFCAYVAVVSLSGSALLLRSPFYQWFEPKYVYPAEDAVALTGAELQQRMREVYEGYNVGFTIEGYSRELATYVVLNRGNDYLPHYFDQYTGQDIGPANPWPIKSIEWVADFHDDLTLGRLGRQLNGVGGLLFVVMSVTGLILWWQGRSRWREGLYLQRGSSRALWWQLHTVFGFWGLVLMVAWGVSGYQLGFPQHIAALMQWFNPEAESFPQGSGLLRWFREIHFARIGSGPVARWAWIIVSFLPTLLLISGLVMWWRRVVRGRWLRRTRTSATSIEGAVLD